MQQHPVFIRPLDKKAVIVTIINHEELELPTNDDTFIIGNTNKSIYTNNNPMITLDMSTALVAEEYLKTIGEDISCVKGNGINGIITSPIWWIRKTKSVFEMMG